MGQIHIASRRLSKESLLRRFPGAQIVDTTSKGNEFIKLSPFYPHGGIPVPFSKWVSYSVEGVWQGLKVFENEGVDFSCFENHSMRNIKRTIKKHGRIRGHQRGDNPNDILGFVEAKREIYIPTYEWVLKNRANGEIDRLRLMAERTDLVLLDYNTCECPFDPIKPLSHASLVRAFISGAYPTCGHGDELNLFSI